MPALWEDRIRRGYRVSIYEPFCFNLRLISVMQLLMSAGDAYAMVYGLATTQGKARASIAEIQAAMAKEKEEKEGSAPVKVAKAANGNGYATDTVNKASQ
jgi:hypothetical protein